MSEPILCPCGAPVKAEGYRECAACDERSWREFDPSPVIGPNDFRCDVGSINLGIPADMLRDESPNYSARRGNG